LLEPIELDWSADKLSQQRRHHRHTFLTGRQGEHAEQLVQMPRQIEVI
jgi:hypothetical protein